MVPGDDSVTSLLLGMGWTTEQLAGLRTQLFDRKEESGVHPNCTEQQVCWPDLQQAFRSVVCDGEWSEEDSKEWNVQRLFHQSLRGEATIAIPFSIAIAFGMGRSRKQQLQ